jgi:pimeloyl-ACP methyl ester carboxylesterase
MEVGGALPAMDFPRPPKRKRWPRRIALVGTGLVVAVVVTCFLVQWRRDAAFAAQSAPGSFVAVDGHRIHYRLVGRGDVTFVLEAGLGDYSANWGGLEGSLADMGRVFVYDRAGTGWSEAGPEPRSPDQIVKELHAALVAAQVPKPWILVGHSWGGYTQMLFAEQFPEGVAGLFLIDPSHPQQFRRIPAAKPPRWLNFAMAQFPRLARSGLPQLLYRSPEPIKMTSRYLDAAGAEFRAALVVGETPDVPLPHLGKLPLYILSSGELMGPPGEPVETTRFRQQIWLELHEELMTCSSGEIHRHIVVERAGHYIHLSRPNTVAQAAKEFTEQIQHQHPAEAPP